MKITAITRYKHGELYAILQRLGWTQSELARRAGIQNSAVGCIINLVKRPTVKQADAIQEALGTAGEWLDVLAEWPETFEGLGRGYRREQTQEIPMERLIDHPEVLQLAAPESEDDGLLERMDAAIGELTPRQQALLTELYVNGKTLKKAGRAIGVSRERARQIQSKVLRRIRTLDIINQVAQEAREEAGLTPSRPRRILRP